MKCINCNSEVVDGMQFCPYCGSPMVSQQSQQGQYQQPQLVIQMEGKILKTKYAFNVVIDGRECYKLNAKDFVETKIPITSNEIKIKTSSLGVYSIDLNLLPNRSYKCVIGLNSLSLPKYELFDEGGNLIIEDGEVNWLIFIGSMLIPLIGFIYYFVKRKTSPLAALLGVYFGVIGLLIVIVRMLI